MTNVTRKRLREPELVAGQEVKIYDSGPRPPGFDRYTVVLFGDDWIGAHGYHVALALSEGGETFSQFTECDDGPHLGKRVPFASLSQQTQDHIARRISTENAHRFVIELTIFGDADAAETVLDRLLDDGVFQDPINRHEVEDAGPLRVLSASARRA